MVIQDFWITYKYGLFFDKNDQNWVLFWVYTGLMIGFVIIEVTHLLHNE